MAHRRWVLGLALSLSALVGLAFGLFRLPASADGPARLHEARLTYRLDRSLVPAWVMHRELTLVVPVGPALGVAAFGDGQPVPSTYDGQYARVTTGAQEVLLVVTAPDGGLGQIGQPNLAALRDDKRWALSITLDDGYVSQATTAKDLLARYGWAGAIAVIGSRIGTTFNGDTYASAAQLQAAIEAGWALANHSNSHQYAANIGNESAIVQDLLSANNAIRAAVPGYTPLMFTSPYVDTAFTPIVNAHRAELGFHLIQTYGWEGREVDPASFQIGDDQLYSIGRTQLLYDGSQFDEVSRWLQQNPGKHLWLSLHTHDVAPACDCVETASDVLYRTYGAGGSDEVWVAPAPDVLEYLTTRERAMVTETSRNLVGEPPPGWVRPTPSPEPPVYRVVLQRGHEGYTGVRDTYIDSLTGNNTKNYGATGGIVIRTQGQISGLLSFDLGRVPAQALIQRATLLVYGMSQTNSSVTCLEAYPLLRPWEESGATWMQARQNDAWGAPGATALGVDRASMPSGLRGLTQGINHWYEVELGDAVRQWMSDPASNQGVLLAGVGQTAKQLSLASSEYSNPALRPKLIVSYTLPLDEPVVTPPSGDSLLVGTVLLEGRGAPPSAAFSLPLTVTLQRASDGVVVLRQPLTTNTRGEFMLQNIPSETYNLTVTGLHSLRAVRQGLTLYPGLNLTAVGPLVEGDINQDEVVDARDEWLLRSTLGSLVGEEDYRPEADLNGDGAINAADLGLLSKNYNRYGAAVQTGDSLPGYGQPLPDASVQLKPANVQARVGQMVTFELRLDTGSHAADGADLWLDFDPQVLKLSTAELAGPWPLLPGNDLSGQNGRLHYAAGSLADPRIGNLALLRLSFLVVGQSPAQGIKLAFSPEAARVPQVFSGGYNVLSGAQDATLVINGYQATIPLVCKGSAAGLTRLDMTPITYTGAISLPILGDYPLAGASAEARDVRVQGRYGYMPVAYNYGDSYLYVLDLADPSAPTLAAKADGTSFEPDEVWLLNGRAYVARKGRGVGILNLANSPAVPELGQFYWNPDVLPIAKGVHVLGNRLYVADEAYGLQVVDVTYPHAPTLLGAFDEGTFGEGVWVSGTTAYVAAGRPGVRVIDVSNPYKPTPLHAGAIWIPGRAVDVQVEGNLLYVAAEDNGVTVLDVTDPQEPVFKSNFDTCFAQKLDVIGNRVYVADDRCGLIVLDASDPTALKAIGQCDTPGRAFGVSVVESADPAQSRAYVADGTEGLQVVDLGPLGPAATVTPTATPLSATPAPTATPTAMPSSTPSPEPTGAPVLIPLVMK